MANEQQKALITTCYQACHVSYAKLAILSRK